MKKVKVVDKFGAGKFKIKKIELADQSKVIQLDKYVKKVLIALGHSEALVTDESCVSDFLDIFDADLREKQVKKVEKKLKMKITKNDYIWQVAERIQNASNK
jgi:hypothetical protein